MTPKFQSLRALSAATFLVVAGGAPVCPAQTGAGTASDRPGGGDPDSAVRLAEAATALGAALDRIGSLEARIAALEERNRALVESLAAANAEADQFREDYRRLRLKLEAFGVDVLRKDPRGLDKRLLAAVNDVRISEEQKALLAGAVVRLSEEALGFIGRADGVEPSERASLEAALRDADETLRRAQSPTPLEQERRKSEQAQVISFQPDLGLVVLDTGADGGLRIGAPLQILRRDRPVASALVVDVRDGLSGALLTRWIAGAESIEVGDIARLDTLQPITN